MRDLTIPNKITSRETHSFNQYLKDISLIKLFTPEEEQICAEKASQGDENAIEELTRRNLRFVVSVAKQYVNTTNSVEDLVNEGNIGLMVAVKHFKPEKGFKFITYAVFWIRKHILDHMGNNGRIIRLPANIINKVSKMEKNICKLEQKLGRTPDISEIIDEFGVNDIDDEDIILIKSLSSFNVASLDKEINGDQLDQPLTLLDIIADNSSDKTDHLLTSEFFKKEITTAVNQLKPINKRIMIASFGLDGNTPLNLEEIGEIENLSRERIRQIKKKSLKLLFNKLKNSGYN